MATTHASDGTGFKHDVHALGQGVEALKTDAGNLARGAMDAARSGASELRQGAQHAVETAKDAAVDAAHSLKEVIARNPVASMGVAAGVGFLLGLALFRPRS